MCKKEIMYYQPPQNTEYYRFFRCYHHRNHSYPRIFPHLVDNFMLTNREFM